MKFCSKCGENKPTAEFAKAKTRRDGLSGWCKACHRADYQAKRDTRRAQQREYKEDRRKELAAAQRAYYRDNRAACREYARRWAERNIEKVRRESLAYATKVRVDEPLNAEALAYWQILDADPCAYCGGGGGEKDHIEAVSAGGSNRWDNFTASCRSCNASKSNKTLLAFLST